MVYYIAIELSSVETHFEFTYKNMSIYLIVFFTDAMIMCYIDILNSKTNFYQE